LENVYDSSLFTHLIFRENSESNIFIENSSSDKNKTENTSRNANETDAKDEKNSEKNRIYPKAVDGFLRVKIPVAEVEGDFRMIPGGTVNEGRECETLVQVLQYGTYQVRTLQQSTVCMNIRNN
jgi:hypothetical protein